MAETTPKQGDHPIKFTITHYRLPQHTHEAFIKWITDEHLPLAMPVLKRHGVLGYSLVGSKQFFFFPKYQIVMRSTLLLLTHTYCDAVRHASSSQ